MIDQIGQGEGTDVHASTHSHSERRDGGAEPRGTGARCERGRLCVLPVVAALLRVQRMGQAHADPFPTRVAERHVRRIGRRGQAAVHRRLAGSFCCASTSTLC